MNGITVKPEGRWEKIFKPIDVVVDSLFPPLKYYYAVFIISIVFIAGLSWILVESAIVVSEALQVPKVITKLPVKCISGTGELFISNESVNPFD